jgi:pyruvate/2-oxoacid:ferredoxin oxidoreductase alpha subunit
MSAYFTRGTGHDENARYTEDSDVWLRNMDRLKKSMRPPANMPAPVFTQKPGATVGIIAYGSTDRPSSKPCTSSNRSTASRRFPARPRPALHEEVTEFIKSTTRSLSSK